MLMMETFADTGEPAGSLTLPFETRRKSRFRATLDSGEPAGIVLPHGSTLKQGDRLLAADGRVIEVLAAAEDLSEVSATDPLLLARIAYHLGNRHVPVQVGQDCLHYQADHVLDAMVVGLGGVVAAVRLPFEPESGAYGGGHHGHAH